jgi:hypothetical protein
MFAEMPLDNRTVVKFAAGTSSFGFAETLFWPFGTSPHAERFNISQRLEIL